MRDDAPGGQDDRFLVFGGFVGLSQWLMPYYVNVYGMTVTAAGLMASSFSLPSSLVRAVGGWLSDKWSARRVMYIVLSGCAIACVLLSVPRRRWRARSSGNSQAWLRQSA